MLVIALALGWLVDRHNSQTRFRHQLRQESEKRALAESQFFSFATWFSTEYSLGELPQHFQDYAAETATSPESFVPDSGFLLARQRTAHMTLAYVGLNGDGFRVRGGPFRYELIGEDLSGEAPSTCFRLSGPGQAGTSENVDGVFTFVIPRLFKSANGARRPSHESYILTFSEGTFAPTSVPVREVWPEWIYTAEDVKQVGGSQSLGRSGPIPPGQPVTMFTQVFAAADGRKARVRLTVTSEP